MGNDGLIIESNGQWWIEKGIMAWTNEKERILGSEKLRKTRIMWQWWKKIWKKWAVVNKEKRGNNGQW